MTFYIIIILVFVIFFIARKASEKQEQIQKEQEEIQRKEWEEQAKKARENERLAREETRNVIFSIPKFNIELNPDYILKRNYLKYMPEIKFKNLTRYFNIDTIPAYVVFDVETTGLKPATDRIVELSAILYEGGYPSSSFSTLINPGIPIPSEVSEINNIYDDDVKDAPTLDSVTESFLEFIGNCPLIAYNANFDLKFMYCSGIDLLKHQLFDAYALAKKAYPDSYSYKLENIASNECRLYYDAHSSLADCYATGVIFKDELDIITEF